MEGYGLDRFAAGDWALRSVRQQRIGLLLDADLEPELRQRHLQVADGCRATLGIEIDQASPGLPPDVSATASPARS